jgi:hypothetical protein
MESLDCKLGDKAAVPGSRPHDSAGYKLAGDAVTTRAQSKTISVIATSGTPSGTLGETEHIRLEPTPMLFSSPVSTFLPNQLSDEQEEEDDSTLGRPEPEEEP